MSVTKEQFEFIADAIGDAKNVLISQACDESLKPFYHLQADSLCWADEIPHQLSPKLMRVIQFLLSVRSESFSEGPDAMSLRLFEQLREIVPEWSFLRENRHDSKWLPTLIALRKEALSDLESHFQRRQASKWGQ